MTTLEGPLYLYGVMSASEPAAVAVPGVQDAEVDAVTHAGLAVLASPLSDASLGAAREVRAHWRVLDEASKTATVLPVRFGTVMESEDQVREGFLEPNAERLSGLLSEVAGCVQLSLKGDYAEELLMRDVVEGSPNVAALRVRLRTMPEAAGYYDRIRLGELVAAEVARRRDEDTRTVLAALEPLAIAAKLDEASHPNAAFNLSFLVTRDAQDRFGKQVGELAKTLGERIEMRYIGPLPPYSFADANIAVEA